MKVFIDSNIPMYVAGTEHPNRRPSLRFLEAVRRGEVEACTSTEVLQEILYRYHALGRLDLAGRVYDLFVALVSEVLPVTLADTDLARDLLVSTGGISARDAVHGAVMINHGIEHIATFDRGFDRIGRVERVGL
ncbi:MAG TPA: type II toxin-antitoxin system VapC family toxin [Longimicrobiales bacterium]|nr:type II toxin-antitoxin system VapC family toxin [Longimicrobiales bacterium]